mmetsp:Transcript_5582/g.13105  ORF Transcript_5582/g.13105 Transcript_5582/m.13105 type:complete len:585 (-) Transcript_5582:37-1791(-)
MEGHLSCFRSFPFVVAALFLAVLLTRGRPAWGSRPNRAAHATSILQGQGKHHHHHHQHLHHGYRHDHHPEGTEDENQSPSERILDDISHATLPHHSSRGHHQRQYRNAADTALEAAITSDGSIADNRRQADPFSFSSSMMELDDSPQTPDSGHTVTTSPGSRPPNQEPSFPEDGLSPESMATHNGHAGPGGMGRHELTPQEEAKLREEWKSIEPRLQLYLEEQTKQSKESDASWRGWWRSFFCALGGGTGATVGGTGLWFLDKDLANRMQVQDEAVLFLLLLIYFLTLIFSGAVAYRQAKNRSPVHFYADPRYDSAASEDKDPESFLEAFNQRPNNAYLRITGYSPTYQDAPGSVRWRGTSYLVDFTFSLDLSSWVMPEPIARSVQRGQGVATSEVDGQEMNENGVNLADLAELHNFLDPGRSSQAHNDMAIVEMRKYLSWANWEELATNIKWRMRHCGFTGVIHVDRTDCDVINVYKNTQWANFMHSKTLKVIIALSVVGWLVYAPYMWWRCSRLSIRSYHRVDITIDEYWPLIAEHIGIHGFESMGVDSVPRPGPLSRGLTVPAEDISWTDDEGDADNEHTH